MIEYIGPIEQLTLNNTYFRQVLFTAPHSQHGKVRFGLLSLGGVELQSAVLPAFLIMRLLHLAGRLKTQYRFCLVERCCAPESCRRPC